MRVEARAKYYCPVCKKYYMTYLSMVNFYKFKDKELELEEFGLAEIKCHGCSKTILSELYTGKNSVMHIEESLFMYKLVSLIDTIFYNEKYTLDKGEEYIIKDIISKLEENISGYEESIKDYIRYKIDKELTTPNIKSYILDDVKDNIEYNTTVIFN